MGWARAIPNPYSEARILVELGLLASREGRDRTARGRLEEALAIFRRLGAKRDIELVAEAILALPVA